MRQVMGLGFGERVEDSDQGAGERESERVKRKVPVSTDTGVRKKRDNEPSSRICILAKGKKASCMQE